MVVDEEALEHRLLMLGREEIGIEQKMQSLRVAGRDAAQQGRLDDAEAIWKLYEALKAELVTLQPEIMLVERDLFRMRRRKR